MGKITFRADDDLVDELEAFDVSKSEVMREALRSYLERRPSDAVDGAPSADEVEGASTPSIDALVEDRIEETLADRTAGRGTRDSPDVNVRITVDAEGARRTTEASDPGVYARIDGGTGVDVERDPRGASDHSEPAADAACGQCGTRIDADHVYCPNCGEKAAHRVFCECGDEVRSDWAFCPSCGRRTPAADVLDSR